MKSDAFAAAGMTVFERGWLSSNGILFDAGPSHETVLIDSGYCTHAAQTVAMVRRALGTRRLDRLLNTHLHSDHCGGNQALQQAFACAVAVPAGEAAKVDQWDESRLSFQATGQDCPRFSRTGVLRVGDTLQCGSLEWTVLAAPGHDPESIVLHQPEHRLLISADALWENGFGVVFPELDGENAFQAVGETLDRLSALAIDWVIPGHGSPFSDHTAAIDRARRRLDAFIASPVRHAAHAAKVLIKFHLLAIQEEPVSRLMEWINATPLLRQIHAGHFIDEEFEAWRIRLLTELHASSAISLQAGNARNV